MDNKSYHHGDLKNKLMKSGIEIINKEGVDKLSLRKVATICGVSHGAPYSHFKDKEDFIKSIKKFAIDEFSNVLLESIKEGNDKRINIINLGKAYVLFFAENTQYLHFIFSQEDFNINLKANSLEVTNCRPFEIFKDTAEEYLDTIGIKREDQVNRIITMWAIVHGITMLVIMNGVTYEGDFGDLVEDILKNRLNLGN